MKLVRELLSYVKIVAILSSLIFTACLREQKEAPLAQRSGYVGCLDAVATGKDSIEVTVNMPSQATEVQVFRNNTLVGSVFPNDSQNNVFNDTLLPVQGEVYKYSCKAITPNEDLVGYNEPTVKTTPEDAPLFEGLKTVSIENNIHAKLTWKSPASNGPKVVKYQVYANMNRATGSMTPNVDFTQTPVATVSAPATEYTVTEGLGDKIPYVFSVLACTHNDICAGSDVYKTASTLDNGKPETTGISNIETLSGGIKVTAPWNESMGETTKRVLYMGTSNSTNLADYTQIRAFNISTDNLKDKSYMQGMTTFEVVDSRIQENTLYYFALVDQDSNGNSSTVVPYELQTYDLTPPNFVGITDISPNSLQPATAMDITFPASNTEGAPDNDPTGASSYVVEYTQTPYVDGSTAWPADPCTSGTRYGSTFSANPGGVAGGTSVTITVSGLSPRTFYRFCVRAKDAYGNESGDLSTSVTIPVATLDSAAPVFDGIQGLSGVTPGGVYSIKVDWNKASDLHSNVKYYQLKLWSNTADSSAASDLKTINRSASNSSYDTGTLIENGTDFDYGQGTRVYVLVNACDDADTIPDGSINCTNYDDTLAMSIIPPDIEPPQNFTGISSATSTVSNGVATLNWYEPTPWSSDYFGFRIYNSVYNSGTSKYDLTLLKSCNCASPGNCTSPTDLSCDVGNLDPNREYRFHVRAVDAAGNETQTNPQVSWEAVTIKDGISPTFTPNLAGDWSVADQAIKLNWNAATDNQYSGDIRYEIYRRQPGQSDFTAGEIANPTETPRATVTNVTEYIDTDSNYSTVGGGDYYYLICAKDAQNNRTCATSSLNVFLPDIRPPDILTELESDKSTDTNNLLRLWDLSFKVTDNNTRLERLDVKVYTTFTDSAEVPAEISANLDSDGNSDSNRTDNTSTDYITITNLRGEAQSNGYVNYKVVVIDEYGNKSSKTVSYTYDARLTITSIAANKANKDLSKEVVIQGSGFSKGTENGTGIDTQILLGSESCINPTIYGSTVMTCETPIGVGAGVVNVSLQNPDGVQASLSGGFTFTDGLSFPHATCDTQIAQDGDPFAAGAGTVAEPYIICNTTQFLNINKGVGGYFTTYPYRDDYFSFGAHINASSIAGEITPFFNGEINGNGYMIYNNTNGRITTLRGTLKNLVFFNSNAFFITNFESGTLSNISFANTNWRTYDGAGYYKTDAFIANLVYTTSPITIENIHIDLGTIDTVKLIYNPLFKSITSFADGDAILTLNNLSFRGSITHSNTSSFTFSPFQDMANTDIQDVSFNYTFTHSGSGGLQFAPLYRIGTVDPYRFNNTATGHGVKNFKNVTINIKTNKGNYTGGHFYLKEGGTLQNVDINLELDNTFLSTSLFNNLKLGRGTTIKNLNFKINSVDTNYNHSFARYLEYDARTEGAGDILIEDLDFVGGDYFIGWMRAIDDHSPSTPTQMQKIKFSKINTISPLIHIFDLQSAGSFSDLSTPAIEIENVKIRSKVLLSCYIGCSENPNAHSPIVSGITNYNQTDYRFTTIYYLTATTYWLTPAFQPKIKLNKVLVVPDGSASVHPNIVSQQADSSDTVVEATYQALCNTTGSTGNFYTNQIVGISDNSAHTTCNALTAESDENLQDSSTGNVFETAGWDFTNVWKWPDGGGYPELR